MLKSILKRTIISTLVVPLVCILIFSGCSKNEETVHSPTNISTTPQQMAQDLGKAETSNLKFYNHVKILTQSQQQKLTSFNETKLVFKLSDETNFKVGDVINSGPINNTAPMGLNEKVLEIKVNGNEIILHVKRAELSDVIESGEFKFGERVDPSTSQNTLKSWGQGNFTSQQTINITGKVCAQVNGNNCVTTNIQGGSWTWVWYKRSGIFGSDDDYLIAGNSICMGEDKTNPDFKIQIGAKFDLDLIKVNLSPYGFWIGPVWIYFTNALSFGLKTDIVNNSIVGGVDIVGCASVEVKKFAGQSYQFNKMNDMRVNFVNPDFLDKSKYTSASISPRLQFQSKLYGTDAFSFYGQFGIKNTIAYNPWANDYYIRWNSNYWTQGGVKGKIFWSNYDYNASHDFPPIAELKFFPVYDPLGISSTSRIRTIRSSKINRYMSSENGNGNMYANRTAIGDWEKFTILYNAADNTYSFQGNNGKYVYRFQPQTLAVTMICGEEDRYQDYTHFYITKMSNGKYRIAPKSLPNLLFAPHTSNSVVQGGVRSANDSEWIIN